MMALRWLFLAVAGMAFTLFAMLAAPVLPLFVGPDGYLPRWLWWFQTPDNPAWGDKAFHENQMAWTQIRYLRTVFWLWRNPSYGFDFAVLGARVPEGFAYSCSGNERVSNSPLHEGLVIRRMNQYWQLYYVKAWNQTKCLRINLGWKLWGDLTPGQVCPLVVSVNPWMMCEK